MERTLTLLFAVLLSCGPALAEEASDDGAASQGEASAEEQPADDVDELIRGLRAYEVQERIDAVQALAERGDESAVPALVNSLRSDPSPHVRGWAVRALHHLDTPEAHAAVAAAREDADDRVSSLAVRLAGPAPTARREERLPTPTGPPPTVDPAETGARPVPVAGQERLTGPQRHRARVQERRRNRPDPHTRMIPAGWATFGATYGIALIFGASFMALEPEIGGPGIVPLIGTAIVGVNTWYQAGDEPGLVALGMMAWLNSMFQITSFIIAMFGHRQRRADDRRRASSSRRRGFTVAALPGENPGIAVSGWF